jgi:hypothetical protein
MKTCLLLLIVLPIGLLLSGCASLDAPNTKPMLSASGFRTYTPKTAEQQRLYNELPAYKLQRGTFDGKTFYAYKDEKQGVAYVGDEAAYQKYQALAVQRRIASDHYHAARMNESAAFNWYGAYYSPMFLY